MKHKGRSGTLAVTTALLGMLAFAACDDSVAVKENTGSGPTPGIDGGRAGDANGLDAGTLPDGAPKDCFDNPQTHFEIINACTNATRITKAPTLPKLLADGGLPPLN